MEKYSNLINFFIKVKEIIQYIQIEKITQYNNLINASHKQFNCFYVNNI